MEADLNDVFETARTLVGTLGFPVFEPLTGSIGPQPEEYIFYCTGPEANARGMLVEDGFVVLKDSVARADLVASAEDSSVANHRREMLSSGLLVEEGNSSLRFTGDYLFNSPSGAAIVVLGRHANGWKE